MKRVLILGAAGMAGHMISSYLQSTGNYEILNTVRTNPSQDLQQVALDLKDHTALQKIISSFEPDIVVNCAGILVQNSQAYPAEAIHTNSYLPHYLAQLGDNLNFKLIHISTDCVFEGTKGQYTEHDFPDATTMYGRSKALGEIIAHQKHITIRTSIIGPELKPNGTGLMHWFLHQTGVIKGYSRAIWSGVTTLELAKFINSVLQAPVEQISVEQPSAQQLSAQPSIAGLYHLTNNDSISKFELLQLIKEVCNISHISILEDANYCVDKSIMQTQISSIGYQVPSYMQMITELCDYMIQHAHVYNHYPFFQRVSTQ